MENKSLPDAEQESTVSEKPLLSTSPADKCLYCYSQSDILRCLPCGHQCVCIECFGTAFDGLDECPACSRTVKFIRMPAPLYTDVKIPIQDEDEDTQCVICVENCKPAIVFPCAHRASCRDCTYNLDPKKCPLCRSTIKCIKAPHRPPRGIKDIEQEIEENEDADLVSTMQVVFFSNMPPPVFFQVQSSERQTSTLCHNWKFGHMKLRFTWYSSLVHICRERIISAQADIIGIARRGNSSMNYHDIFELPTKVMECFENMASHLSHTIPILSSVVLFETNLSFTKYPFSFLHPGMDVLFEDEGLSTVIFNIDNTDLKDTLLKHIWKLANDAREKRVEMVRKMFEEMRSGHSSIS